MFSIQRTVAGWTAVLGWLLVSAALAGDGSPPAPPAGQPPGKPPGDEAESTDSTDSALDAALFAPSAGTKAVPGAAPAKVPDMEALNQLLQRELGEAATDQASNPLLPIARQMRSVENRIGQIDSGDQTQQMQGRIVANLDELIRQAQSRCKKCCGGAKKRQHTASRRPPKQPGKPKPSPGSSKPKPVRTSNAQPGSAQPAAAERNEMIAVLKRIWGELPEAQRQQMLQLPAEMFLPKYKSMIEQYYRRLADEQSGPTEP